MSDDFDYASEVNRLLLAMQFLASIQLREILSAIENAHTLGPFIDPTKYRDALYRGDMDAIRALASALVEPVNVFREKIAPKMPAATA